MNASATSSRGLRKQSYAVDLVAHGNRQADQRAGRQIIAPVRPGDDLAIRFPNVVPLIVTS
jgi:hypothetical protein